MRLSRLSDRQLRRLVRNAEVRFGFNMTPEKYKRFVQKVIDEYAGSIVRSISNEDVFEDYEVSPEIQRKIKVQLSKAINELKKIPGLIK